MSDLLAELPSFDGFADLITEPFVVNVLIACAVLGLVAGVLTPLVVIAECRSPCMDRAESAFIGGAAGGSR